MTEALILLLLIPTCLLSMFGAVALTLVLMARFGMVEDLRICGCRIVPPSSEDKA